jgi:hypothetical protein
LVVHAPKVAMIAQIGRARAAGVTVKAKGREGKEFARTSSAIPDRDRHGATTPSIGACD